MIKYVAFTYNKHIYATCYGIDPYAADKCPYKNIFDPSTAGRGELKCFTNLTGGNEYSLPRLQDVEIKVDDKVARFLAGKGWTEVAGVRYNIEFDSNGIKCFDSNGVDINAEQPEVVEEEHEVVEEVTPEPTVVIEEAPELDLAHEPVKVVETSSELEMKEEATSEVALEVGESVAPDFSTLVSESIKTSFAASESPELVQSLKELAKESEVEDVKVDFTSVPDELVSASESENTTVVIESESTIMNPPEEEVADETVEEAPSDFMSPPVESNDGCKSGISFGTPSIDRSKKSNWYIGADNPVMGMRLGATLEKKETPAPTQYVRQRYTRTGRPTAENPLSRAVDTPIAPSPEFAKAIAESEEKMRESWREQERVVEMPTVSSEVRQELPEDMNVTDDSEQREAMKKAFRESIPPEINNVIGDIPLSIIGPLAEFTTNPVNTRALAVEKDAYCIDNRWHKAGKWYCIDVVNETARYFFNSKLNVSIQIPQSILKEWLSIVKG